VTAEEIYNQVVAQSGQVQLTLPSFYLYVNQAQRWLDLHVPTEKDPSISFAQLASGEASIDLPRAITVEAVQALEEGSSVPYELKRVDNTLGFIRKYDLEDGDKSSPAEYTVSSSVAIGITSGHPANKAIPEQGDRLRVLVGPRVKVDTNFAILGRAYAARLDSKESASFWTTHYPDLLTLATLYVMECYFRNTEGQRDWLTALEPLIRGLEEAYSERRTGHLKPGDDPSEVWPTRWEKWQWPGMS